MLVRWVWILVIWFGLVFVLVFVIKWLCLVLVVRIIFISVCFVFGVFWVICLMCVCLGICMELVFDDRLLVISLNKVDLFVLLWFIKLVLVFVGRVIFVLLIRRWFLI